jgi:hypothetical protein
MENLPGIKARTIRIWKHHYSFQGPKRSDTNTRYYTNEESRVSFNIVLLNKYSHKILHPDKMSREAMFEHVPSLTEFISNQ